MFILIEKLWVNVKKVIVKESFFCYTLLRCVEQEEYIILIKRELVVGAN